MRTKILVLFSVLTICTSAQTNIQAYLSLGIGYMNVQNTLVKQQGWQTDFVTQSLQFGLQRNRTSLNMAYYQGNNATHTAISNYQVQLGYTLFRKNNFQLIGKAGLGTSTYEILLANSASINSIPMGISAGAANSLLLENKSSFSSLQLEVKQRLGKTPLYLSYQVNYQLALKDSRWTAYKTTITNPYQNSFTQFGMGICLNYHFSD